MRINDGNRCVHRRPFRCDKHFVRPAIRHLIRFDAAPFQIAARLAHRPTPDDVTPKRDHIPRMDLLRPRRHLLRMLLHELLDSRLICLDRCPHFRADLPIFLPADLRVPPHTLNQIVLEIFRPKDLGHRASGLAIILQQFLQPVFRLRVTDRKQRRLESRGKDVRNPEFIPVNRRLLLARFGQVQGEPANNCPQK